MSRLLLGIVVVSIVAIFLFWSIVGLAFAIVRMAIGVLLFVFCIYIIYLLAGAFYRLFRGGNRGW